MRSVLSQWGIGGRENIRYEKLNSFFFITFQYLACSGFDLYGDLHKKYNNYFETAFEDALKRQEEEEKAQRQRFWQKLDLGESKKCCFLMYTWTPHFVCTSLIKYL